jgi:uncharacterized membrane protein
LKPLIHRSHTLAVYFVFAILLLLVLFFVIFYSFKILGFTPLQIVLITFLSLIGANINIPVATIRSKEPIVLIKSYTFFGIEFYVPFYSYENVTVAVNVGGALIPVLASAYLFLLHLNMWFPILISVIISTLFIHSIAKPVKGLGIVTPFFISPIFAALLGIFLGGKMAPVVAYIAGTMGSLIGADLLNLNKIDKLGASFVSIGGAGIFDGVFLTGLVAALLTI